MNLPDNFSPVSVTATCFSSDIEFWGAFIFFSIKEVNENRECEKVEMAF